MTKPALLKLIRALLRTMRGENSYCKQDEICRCSRCQVMRKAALVLKAQGK